MSKRFNIAELFWNLIVVFSSSFYAFYLPLDLLGIAGYGQYYYMLELFCTMVFVLDLLFNLYKYRRADHEFIFENTSGIAVYFKKWFLIDLIPIIPFNLFFPTSYIELFRIIKLIKVAYLMRIFKRREVQFANTLTLVFFFYWISHFAHWLACGWLSLRGIDEIYSELDNYVRALYWTITTITTVGYGDIVPLNTSQTLYALFVEIIGVGSYGYLIGKIANFLSKKDPAKNQYLTNLDNLSTLVKLRSVPNNLQRKLRDYYNYIYKQKSGFDESKFLEGLPESLKLELSIALKKEAIAKIPLFSGESNTFLEEISLHLKPLILTPGDYLFREGDEGKEMYFVIRGELEVLIEKENKIISILKEGDFFGEIALFLNVPRTATIKAVEYCDLYTLAKSRFEYVISKYPEIEKEIRQKINDRNRNES